ncbi:GNAT family N-acetyltransferase [Sediminibacillus massiliensis]|uniref:GNAT family N-acetyltransferase n=1 Tax=Sediminibacillus massiliensis TaxID=1926277 RepID=UPI0009885814|nr:GNAT family N-acetyltransferase [Sediminibacillus massiliensis]
MEWILKTYQELTKQELYNLIKTRIDVFVVEQSCPYHELDNYDQVSEHLMLKKDSQVIAYARLLPSNTVYALPSIGRVLVHKDFRNRGYAKELLKRSISTITEGWGEPRIKIQGQEYLRSFYGSFGFRKVSSVYLDDGIPHVDMVYEG